MMKYKQQTSGKKTANSSELNSISGARRLLKNWASAVGATYLQVPAKRRLTSFGSDMCQRWCNDQAAATDLDLYLAHRSKQAAPMGAVPESHFESISTAF